MSCVRCLKYSEDLKRVVVMMIIFVFMIFCVVKELRLDIVLRMIVFKEFFALNFLIFFGYWWSN